MGRSEPILSHGNVRPYTVQRSRWEKRKDDNYGLSVIHDTSQTVDFGSFKISARWKLLKFQHDGEIAFRDFIESRTTDFYSSAINTLLSEWSKVVANNGACCY